MTATSSTKTDIPSDFFDAIQQGHAEEVKRRLALDPSLIHTTENGLSPVLVAAYRHEPELVKAHADPIGGGGSP